MDLLSRQIKRLYLTILNSHNAVIVRGVPEDLVQPIARENCTAPKLHKRSCFQASSPALECPGGPCEGS